MSVSIWEEIMLYDELVPKGEYLAHYGVPKDQWSPEAKARHNRKHPNKTVDPGAVSRTVRVLRNTYNEYQEDNHNRGGNRSTFGSKVDEQRAQLAEARHNRNRNQHTGDQGNKPYSGQHTPNYRKPRSSSYKTPGANAKPGRGGSSGKPTSSNSGYNALRARFTRKPDPSLNDVEAERRTNTSITPNRSAGKKPSSGKSYRKTSSKNANTRSSYKPETTNAYSYGPNAKHTPEYDDTLRQLNRVDYVLNRSGRNLREYSHNGQLVKQNPSINRVAEANGGTPNNIRVVTKGRKKSKSRRN